ncbi:hypothetical protein C8Q80DRAFT_1159038 [Daedaleopsis nitida]|nr:hypothetical protein C8Q80DRAFT_1159038 [Daedaleopsis nitida]
MSDAATNHRAGHVPVPPPDIGLGRCRRKWYFSQLKALVKHAIDINPWAGGHGEKGPRWAEVLGRLHNDGLVNECNIQSIRNKVDQLITYQTNSESKKGKKIDRQLSESEKIELAALLNHVSELKASAKMMSDKKCADTVAKENADRIAGEAIHKASMTTMSAGNKRSRVESSEAENEDASQPSSKRDCFHAKDGISGKLLEYLEGFEKRQTEQVEKQHQYFPENLKQSESDLSDAFRQFPDAIRSIRVLFFRHPFGRCQTIWLSYNSSSLTQA